MTQFNRLRSAARRLPAIAAALIAGLSLLWGFAAQAASRRVALVVGVANYQAVSPLRNTINDSIRMAATLERLGFEVTRVADPGRSDFVRAIRDFGANARDAEASVFFYAGHALEVSGHNWLLPVDAKLESTLDLRLEALDIEAVLDRAQLAHTAIMFLDACRNNPFAEKLAGETRGGAARGLARIDPASGVLVAFATAPGQVALDGNGANSPFTEALLRYIETPGLEVRQLMSRVRADVRQSTKDQVPWEQSALEGDFFFVAPVKIALPVPAAVPAPAFDTEFLFWDTVRNSAVSLDYEAYLVKFPQGVYSSLARIRIAALLPATVPVPAPAAPTAAPPPPAKPAEAAVVPLSSFTPDVPAQEPAPAPAAAVPAVVAAPAVAAAPVQVAVLVSAAVAEPPPVAAAAIPAAAPPAIPVPAAPVKAPVRDLPAAAVQPVTPAAAPVVVATIAPVQTPAASKAALTRQMESQLKTLGCYSGDTDEDWNGAAASAAVVRLNRANPGRNLLGEPSEELLTRLTGKDVKSCAPECRTGFSAQGGNCVRNACDKGEVRTSRGFCVELPQAQEPVRQRPRPPRHAARPPVVEEPAPAPVRPRPHLQRRVTVDPPPVRQHRPVIVRERPSGPSGGCFTVDGRQYCS